MANENLNPATGEDGQFQVVCTICEASCGMVATVDDGVISKLKPDPNNPHSKGHVCIKGTAAAGLVYNDDRVLTPLKAVDKNGIFEPVSWDEALDDIGARLKSTLETHGPEAMGGYFGNPIFFSAFGFPAIMAFMGTLQTRKLFGPMSQDNLASIIANEYVFGNPIKYPLPDLENCDLLIVFGSNMLVSNGSMLTTARIREQLEGINTRGRVVMVDPRRTESAERYEHFSLKVGTDIWLLSAMVNTLFTENMFDEAFLDREVFGWQDLRKAVAHITPDVAEKHCGVNADDIVKLTREFYETPRAAIASRTGICRNEFATISNVLVDALNIIAGKFSQEGGTMLGYPLLGGMPAPPPNSKSRIGGHRTMNGMWMPSVVMAKEITEPGPDRLRAMVMVAGNPLVSGPGGAELREALKSLDIFVACDFFVNDTNQFADYILPTTTFLERVNMPLLTFDQMLDPVMQYAKPVIEPRGESRTEDWIFTELFQRVFGQPLPPMEMVVDGQLKAGYYGDKDIGGVTGLSLDLLKSKPGGILLPEISKENRWRMGVIHPDAKLHLWHDDFKGEFERLAAYKPSDKFRIFGRRDMRSMNSWLHNVERLVRSQKPTLLIHPEDAKKHSIETGMMVEVSNDYGAMTVEAEVSDEIHPGSLNYPHGWGHDGGWKRAVAAGGGNVNLLAPTDPSAVEMISGASFLDGIPVDIRPA